MIEYYSTSFSEPMDLQKIRALNITKRLILCYILWNDEKKIKSTSFNKLLTSSTVCLNKRSMQ